MKKEIATLKFNLDHIQDRQDSARDHMDRFRSKHPFVQECEEFKARSPTLACGACDMCACDVLA